MEVGNVQITAIKKGKKEVYTSKKGMPHQLIGKENEK